MLISNISFFIDCIESLRPKYKKGNPKQKKQLATFIKTWIWYNSGSQNIFWTGKSSRKGIVKEHWYSNLTTAIHLLKDGLNDKSQKEKIIWLFERMQWNYTSKEENRKLIPEQEYKRFFGFHNGDPLSAYDYLQIDLFSENENPPSKKIRDFLNKERNEKHLIAEIGFDETDASNFMKSVNQSKERHRWEVDILKVSNTNIVISATTFSDLFMVLMTGTLGMLQVNELQDFLRDLGYKANEKKGPYRFINNYITQPNRVFAIKTKAGDVFMTTYNSSDYKYSLLSRLGDYMQINFVFYDHHLKEAEFNSTKI